MGRTGKWWAIEHSGVAPDMIAVAKGIASGLPLGVLITRAEIMDWLPGSHASTFGGNPVAIAAALATIDILEREGSTTPTKSASTSSPALRLAAASAAGRRCPRPRPDDRHRTGRRQDTPRLPPPSSATTSSRSPSKRESCSSAAAPTPCASALRSSSPSSRPTSPSTSSKSASAKWGKRHS